MPPGKSIPYKADDRTDQKLPHYIFQQVIPFEESNRRGNPHCCHKMEADKLKEMLGDAEKEQMKKDMAVQEAVTILADAAKEVEKTEE